MGNRKLNDNELSKLSEDLLSRKSSDRRNSSKKIRKLNVSTLGDELYTAYLKEKKDKRTWETQMEMLQALGKIGYKKALSEAKIIVEKNKKLDMITFIAALTYVRLSKQTNNDITSIIELLKFGELSVLCGAMAALAFDDMIPNDSEIKNIINLIESVDEEKLSVSGVHDPRSYLISAMSKWDLKLTEDFLNKYSDYKSLKSNIEATLLRKKSRIE